MLIFHIFLPLKKPLVVSFNKAFVLSSRKYVSKLGMSIQSLLERLDFFYCTLPKNGKFSDLFTSERNFGDYFQQDVYTHF